MTDKPRVRVPAGSMTADTFNNFAARLGLHTPNLMSASTYTFNQVSRNRTQLEAMYRGSWLVGQAVDTVAEDMTRAGIEYQSDLLAPEQMSKLRKDGERNLDVWGHIRDALKWSRLYGGAMVVLLVDGQPLHEPLRVETVGKGALRGFLVLDKWQVQPSLGTIIKEIGPEMGLPEFYYVVGDAAGLKGMTIHHSRTLRFEGIRLPWYQRVAENFWGQSVIERILDRMIAYDSVSIGAAQLVYKAHLRTVKIESMRELIAMGGTAYEAMIKQLELIRQMQSTEGLTVLDANDDFQTYTYAFAGISDILMQFGQQFSGALGIPLVRLFGQAPAGLNATGDSDWENYYNSIHQQQEAHLRRPLTTLLRVLCPSVLGMPLPDGFDFRFVSLWQMTETERAALGSKVTEAAVGAYSSGVVSRQTTLKELRQQSPLSGLWSNISDEEIEDAEEDLPPINELAAELAPNDEGVLGEPDNSPEGKPAVPANGASRPTGPGRALETQPIGVKT